MRGMPGGFRKASLTLAFATGVLAAPSAFATQQGLPRGLARPLLAPHGLLVPVTPVSGSTSTFVWEINDRNTIVGSYVDSGGLLHGFFGTIDGNYTSFDYGDGTATYARAINDNGWIVGTAADSGFQRGHEFALSPREKFVSIDKDAVPLDGIAQGINDNAQSVGDYLQDGTTLGYEASKGKYVGDVVLSVSATSTRPRGINDAGDIVGYFSDSAGTHGFFQAGMNGNTTIIDYPSDRAASTYLGSINNIGVASGSWLDSNGNSHMFQLDTNTGIFTDLKFKGLTGVATTAPNDHGATPVNSDQGPYIYCPTRKKCPGQ